jgi:WD40 repeat protein
LRVVMNAMSGKPRWHAQTLDASESKRSAVPTAPLQVTPADPHPLETEDADELPTAEARRYTILGEVAQGGLGRILAAEDRTLGRKVAIKELLENRGHARFLREAMVTARLQHPSIVPLYELGRWPSGEPYYSMRLVSGRPFDTVIAATKSLDERLALVPNVIAVADAMAYAHSEQIIHRDLKPANILIGQFGETVVIDWGLAKDLAAADCDDEDGPYRVPDVPAPLTQVGDVLGTPVYMAPEQAKGQVLDQRADVYAIGAILYELLTGQWPHHGVTSKQVIERLAAGEPLTPIEERQPAVPRDLAAIVTKAMTHDRAGRYPSAAELAADLRRFQTGQLVAAHRYSRATLVARWVRRHRAVVAVGSALLAALAITAVVSVRSIVRERNATRAERDRLILANAAGELERDPTAAVAWLKTYPASGGEPDRVRLLAIDARARGVATHVLPRDEVATMGQFSPDGRLFAQPHPSGLRVIELATGNQVGPRHTVNALQWSPDGKRLAIATWATHELSVVDFPGGAVTPVTSEIGGLLAVDVFSRDGFVLPTQEGQLRYFARPGAAGEPWFTPFALTGYARRDDRFVSMSDGILTWWSSSERVAHRLENPPGIALIQKSLTYTFAGTGEPAVVAGTTDGRLCLWSLADGSVRVLDGDGVAIAGMVVSRDGGRAVTLAEDSSLRVWSLATGQSRALPKLGEITDVDLAADGRAIVVGLHDHRILVIDPETGDQRLVGKHAAEVRHVAFSPDGRWIASDADDGTTRLWQVRPEIGEQVPKAFTFVTAIAGAPDRRAFVAGGDRGTALLVAGERRVELPGHAEIMTSVAVSSDGGRAVTAGKGHLLHTWDLVTGTAGPALEAPGGIIWLAMTRDGRKVVACNPGGEIRVWDLETKATRVLGVASDALRPALAPDERTVAVGDHDGGLRLLALDGSATRTLPGAPGLVDILRFSPDGRFVAGGSAWHGQLRLWDLGAATSRELPRRKAGVTAIAFSRDARWLGAASASGDVGLWDLATTRMRTLQHPGDVGVLEFAGNGLVTGGSDGAIRVWDLDATEHSRLRVDGAVMTLVVRDADVIAGTSAGEIYRWPVAALASSGRDQPIAAFLHSLTFARLDAQSKLASP